MFGRLLSAVSALLLLCGPAHAQTVEQMTIVVRLQVAAQAAPRTLVLGDSIPGSIDLSDVCGKTVNAAVPGYSVGQVREMADYAVPLTRPLVVVVNVGTNDQTGTSQGMQAFQAAFSALLDSIPGAKFIIVGAPTKPELNQWFQLYCYLRWLYGDGKATYVPPVNGAGETVDGIHLSEAGAAVYRARLTAACPE